MNWQKTFAVFVGASAIWVCLCVAWAVARCGGIDAQRKERLRSMDRFGDGFPGLGFDVDSSNNKKDVIVWAVAAGLGGSFVVFLGLSPFYKDRWHAIHEGHLIEVENRSVCTRLLVDGELQDQQNGLTAPAKLAGAIKSGQGVGKRIRVSVSGLFKPTCVINVDDSVIFRG